ncbi:MAG: hypothetical protein K2Q32_03460 [Alphaproteobacteria bacterium]|nr:hypothetical protein [Alphaproteobacteria bacterium]
MKRLMPSKKIIKIVGAVVAVVALNTPLEAHAADPIVNYLQSIIGTGFRGGSSGRFVNGEPDPTIKGVLDQIYLQNADNGGVDNNGKRLQTETDIKRTTYQEQNQWERERRLRDDEIARSYPEMSNLSCAMATATQSAPLIDVAADNVTGQVRQLLSDGMYSSLLLATSLSEKNKAVIWCKLGSTGKKGKCDVAADPLVQGAEMGHDDAITIKDSIPCDMPGVIQEFEQMKKPDSWTPNARHKECVAAILSIANEYPISNSRPTKEEVATDSGALIWGKKTNKIAMAAGSKGAILQKFNERVSVPSSMGCEKGIRGGGRDMYTLLKEAYGNQTRQPPTEPSFGLPPSGFCLSKLQFSYGQQLMAEDNERQEAGKRNLIQLTEDSIAAGLINTRSAYYFRKSSVGSGNTNGLEDMDSDLAPRRVAAYDNHEDLIGAIHQLTREIQKMNTGVYAGKPQEASFKKGGKHPAVDALVNDKSAEVSDALKEMGLKISSPAPFGNRLEPITQEFPVLPPQ